MAKGAMEGSSYLNMKLLIQDVMQQVMGKLEYDHFGCCIWSGIFNKNIHDLNSFSPHKLLNYLKKKVIEKKNHFTN